MHTKVPGMDAEPLIRPLKGLRKNKDVRKVSLDAVRSMNLSSLVTISIILGVWRSLTDRGSGPIMEVEADLVDHNLGIMYIGSD